MLLLAAFGDSQPLPDIDGTVEARVEKLSILDSIAQKT